MMTIPSLVTKLATSISAEGGRLLAVGGWVRDNIAKRDSKDVDLEAHNISSDDLEKVLLSHGKVDFVGKSFGVYKVTIGHQTLDVSLPRRDSSPTSVHPDPFMGIHEAARRRDITINAIMLDPLTSEIIDPYNGVEDIHSKILKEVDKTLFSDDPLRVLRVVRFASIFEFEITDSLALLCRNCDLSGVPVERVLTELHRIMLESPHPQTALRVLSELGQLTTVLPFAAEENLDAMIANWRCASGLRNGLSSDHLRLVLMWGAVLQASADEPSGALGHFKIKRYGKTPLLKPVADLLNTLSSHSQDLDTLLRTMAEHCDISTGIALAIATSSTHTVGIEISYLNDRAESLGITKGPLPSLIDGQTLAGLGVSGGPDMGRWIKAVRLEQLAGRLSTRTEATNWVKNNFAPSGD
jgi:tRNA nucleotidyltransferase/poly(A) polymerase